MDFLTEEITKELNLTPEQVAGIKTPYENYIASEKAKWDTKANTDAEGILSGAANKLEEVTSIKRNQGEKLADYYVRAGNEFLTAQKTEVETLKADYAQKLKEFNGGDATKAELQKAQDELDKALVKLADYDSLKEKADKYEPLETEYKSLKDKVFFQNEKPNFPETVNKYEAEAKWNELVKNINDNYEKSFDENGVSILTSKENKHIVKKLSEVIQNDENIKGLLEGRKQPGTGFKPGHKKLADLDIELSVKPSTEEISKVINEKLDKEGIPKMSKERPKKFMELQTKILEELKK